MGEPMKLNPELYVKRVYEHSDIREAIVKPLSKAQKEHLRKNCWEACKKAYVARAIASGLVSSLDTESDLESEAFISMCNIMDRFDLSKCGELSNYDVRGSTKPKTLEFYFTVYFQQRVNFFACDTRVQMRNRNQVPGQGFGQLGSIAENPSFALKIEHAKQLLARNLEAVPEEVAQSFNLIFLTKRKKGETSKLLAFAASHKEAIQSIIEEIEIETGVPFTELRKHLSVNSYVADSEVSQLKPTQKAFVDPDDDAHWELERFTTKFLPTLTPAELKVFNTRFIDQDMPDPSSPDVPEYKKSLRTLSKKIIAYKERLMVFPTELERKKIEQRNINVRKPEARTTLAPKRAPVLAVAKPTESMTPLIQKPREKQVLLKFNYVNCEADALKYASLAEWSRASYVNFMYAKRRGWLDVLKAKMDLQMKERNEQNS
jgi:hypothetical protein